jgi:murein DD-endopeptidase MepM/ murein hydrolase activator NlpD
MAAQGGAARQPHNLFRRTPALPLITITTRDRSRSYAIHPMLWIGGALVATGLALGGIASGLYMAFHDDILEFAINRPIRMEQAYEDRIAALRSEIDRINSRQLLDQDAFETKIGQLMTRQESLRTEEGRVAALLTQAHGQNLQLTPGADLGAISGQLGPDLTKPAARSNYPSTSAAPVVTPPHPIDDTPLRSSWLFQPGALSPTSARDRSAPGLAIARVEADLDHMKQVQLNSIAAVTGLAETHSRAIERVVGRLGLRLADADPQPQARETSETRRRAAGAEGGVGGPLVPILDEGEILTRAETALNRLNQLKEGVGLLPLSAPINGPLEVTSPFGERPDPFLGIAAMHTGVDLRAGYGEPVVATAGGVITEASRQGGYGNMVEIDHGNGIATRYGHLSQFAVVVGQRVKAGHIIGYVGSTGRSTAAHLHYETRVSGVAVNPENYLEAGNQLRPLLN